MRDADRDYRLEVLFWLVVVAVALAVTGLLLLQLAGLTGRPTPPPVLGPGPSSPRAVARKGSEA